MLIVTFFTKFWDPGVDTATSSLSVEMLRFRKPGCMPPMAAVSATNCHSKQIQKTATVTKRSDMTAHIQVTLMVLSYAPTIKDNMYPDENYVLGTTLYFPFLGRPAPPKEKQKIV